MFGSIGTKRRFIQHNPQSLRPFSLWGMTSRQISLERIWFIAVVIWTILRVIFADIFFAKYGVNIWIFAGIEAVSAPVFALASAKMVLTLSQHKIREFIFWGVVTLITFAAPDIYLLTTGKNLPWLAYLVVIGIMVIAGTFSIIEMRRKAEKLAQSVQ